MNSSTCQDPRLMEFCSIFPLGEKGDAVCRGRGDQLRLRRLRQKILSGKADMVDLFELREMMIQQKAFEFRAVSWSMYPAIKVGDRLTVVPLSESVIKVGDIVAYRRFGHLIAHRCVDIQERDGTTYYLAQSDSQESGREGEWVAQQDVLGKIGAIHRRKNVKDIQKKRMSAMEQVSYVWNQRLIKAKNSFRVFAEKTVTGLQRSKGFQVIGRWISQMMKPGLSYVLAIPVSRKALRHVYKYTPISPDQGLPEPLEKGDHFHLILEWLGMPIGLATIFNPPENCLESNICVYDLYLHWPFRGLGLGRMLVQRARTLLD